MSRSAAPLLDSKPIVSVKEARKMLGSIADNLTDGELMQLVNDTETVIRVLLRQYLRSKNVGLQ